MPSRDEIVAEARKWVDVPFRHQGRNERGIDCCGVVIKVAHNLSISNFDISGYRRDAQGHDFRRYLQELMIERLDMDAAMPGDVYSFRDRLSSRTCHAGIVTEKYGQLYIVHAYAPEKRVIEQHLNDEWRSLRTGCFIYPGVT